MTEQPKRKKWIKPQLISLRKFSTVEGNDHLRDESKQILQSANSVGPEISQQSSSFINNANFGRNNEPTG